MKTSPNACDTPLCDTISKGYCTIRGGGVSRIGPLREHANEMAKMGMGTTSVGIDSEGVVSGIA